MDSYHANPPFVKGDLFEKHNPNTIYPSGPGFKVGGGTSEAAAQRIVPLAGRLIKPILQEFVAASSVGMTPDQCAARIGVSVLSMRPRISELKRLGYLVYTGARAPNTSGMTAALLRATPKASEALS
jgi:hypothetical protein